MPLSQSPRRPRSVRTSSRRVCDRRPFRPLLESLEDRLAPDVSLNLVLPPTSTFGVTNSLVIEYTNTGASAEAAPLLVLSADKADLWLPTDPVVRGHNLQVLATASSGPAGTLPPGAHGTIVVNFTSTTNGQNVPIHFTLSQLVPGHTMDWASVKTSMRPDHIPADAWDAVFANFTASVGSTTHSFQAALGADATYLGQLGEPTNDVAQLIAYEINKANNAFSSPPLGASVDAFVPTPGPDLTFERWFQPGIISRYTRGTMGLGWTHNWAVTARTDNGGNVTINNGGPLRYFTLQSDDSYAGTWGDDGTLMALSGGSYQLKELDGSLTTFNSNGTLNYVQDTNGNRITASNTNGLLTRLTATNGSFLAFSYTNGLLTRVTDSANRSNTYTYDAAGEHLLTYTDDFGTTTYSYVTGQGIASKNALASIAFANNTHVFFGYDAKGRLIDRHLDNNQEAVTLNHDSAGGFTITDALGSKTTVLMDDYGQVRKTIDPLDNVAHFIYDLSGNLAGVNGPQDTQWVYTYDLNGNVTSATDPLGLTTGFTHDGRGNLTSYTDARGNTTSYQYDAANNLLAIISANGSQEKFSYNSLGEVTQYINANGKDIDYTYNNNGQVTRATFANGSIYAYTYDTRGNVRTAFNADGAITFRYQDNARPDLITEIEYPDGKFLRFTYNVVGQRTQVVDQTGFTVNYTYDQLGRLQKLTGGNGALIVMYVYDAAGYLIQKDLGNGTRAAYTYDKAGNLLSITNLAPNHVAVNSFNRYTYDALGNVLSDTNQNGQWSYAYDANGQLTEAIFTPNSSNPDGLESQYHRFVYDAAGNRISTTVNGVATSYVTNNVNQYTSSTTNGVATTYQYDQAGNLIAQTTGGIATTYTYNDLGRLVGVNGPGLTANYTYDPLGNRNSQTANGTTTRFLTDPFGLGDVASEYTGSGTLLAHYTYGFGLTSQINASGSAAYYDFNLTGSTVGITGATGSYVNKYSYLPFGETITITAALPNRFTFVGQFGVRRDGSNLFDMRLREYAPATGQFLSNDPLGLAGGDGHLRRYVGNSPVDFIDPEGAKRVRAKPLLYHSLYGVTITYTGPKGPWRYKSDSGETGWITAEGKEIKVKPKKGVNEAGEETVIVTEIITPKNLIQWATSLRYGSGTTSAKPDYATPENPNSGGYSIKLGGEAKLLTPTKQKTPAENPEHQIINKTLSPILQLAEPPLFVAAVTDTTENVLSNVNAPPLIEGVPVSVIAGNLIWGGTPPPPSAFTASTVWSDGVTTQDKVAIPGTYPDASGVTIPGATYAAYAFRVFRETGQYTGVTTIQGPNNTHWTQNIAVIVYDAPWIVNPVNFTVPVGGVYQGPIATFHDLNPYGNPAHYSAGWVNSSTLIPATIVGGGGYFTAIATVDFSRWSAPGTVPLLVRVWDRGPGPNPKGGGDVLDVVTIVDPGTPLYATSVQGQILNKNKMAVDPPLVIIDTTDPNITSLSQISVTVETPSDPNTPVPLITGMSMTRFDGITRIVVEGVASALEPGAGPVFAAPLIITLPGQPPLTAQLMVNQTLSEYTLNAMTVVANSGQPLRNVPVAILAGPVNGDYAATIDWGDGEVSPGQITALGGGLFRVSGSKPHPYSSAGTRIIIVNASGPGIIPASPVRILATIIGASTTPPPENGGGESNSPSPSPSSSPPRGIRARLVTVKVKKKKRLMVLVSFADTGTLKSRFASPFQMPRFRKIRVGVRDGNGDGVLEQVVLTAKKGKKTVTAAFTG